MQEGTVHRRVVHRRVVLGGLALGFLGGKALVPGAAQDAPERESPVEKGPFRLRYILASCMYGTTKLAEILPEVRKTGATHIDIWPRVHGDQREQVEAMGLPAFAALLERHRVGLGMITQYKLGPFKLQREMPILQGLAGRLLISGSEKLRGGDLRAQVRAFAERMKPHVDAAERHGLTIGIENHGGSLIRTPDSMRWLVEYLPSKALGIALAPYHLPQDATALARLIEDLGPRLVHFYAWQHGHGCSKPMPKGKELTQMPGRGSLDFGPIISSLRKIDYRGWTEIFMHPTPRGRPILSTTRAVSDEINRARDYLERLL